MKFSSIDSRTIKLTTVTVSVNVSGWDLLGNLFGIYCFFLI